MASDSKVFHRALEKWRDHHVAGELSEIPRFGQTAILFSTVGSVSEERQEEIEYQTQYFEKEASYIQKKIQEMGGKAVLFAGFTPENLKWVLEDRQIASITLVGDGGFSFIYNDEGAQCGNEDDFIDWDFIADETTHLKQGRFIQRTCGHFSTKLSVPFGAFAMSSHANVFSPLGEYFAPEQFPNTAFMRSPEEQKMVQVYHGRELSYAYIRAAYNRALMDAKAGEDRF